jgi:hypothetical protein
LHHIIIRSLGGLAATKKLRWKGRDRLRGDERILGGRDFVTLILGEANEKLDRYYKIKSRGYIIEKVEKRVMILQRWYSGDRRVPFYANSNAFSSGSLNPGISKA